MRWEEVRDYVSANFRIVSEKEESIIAWVKPSKGAELAFFFSYFEDNGLQWLTIRARIGKVHTNAYQKLIESKDLFPNGGFDIIGGEIWLRNAYPISSIIQYNASGVVHGNELGHCIYCLISDAQSIINAVFSN